MVTNEANTKLKLQLLAGIQARFNHPILEQWIGLKRKDILTCLARPFVHSQTGFTGDDLMAISDL